jgi:hypothetical protein
MEKEYIILAAEVERCHQFLVEGVYDVLNGVCHHWQ